MKVEYLVLIKSEEQYCRSITSLNYLIQSYDGIKIDNDSLSYAGCKFGYAVKLGNSDDVNHRFFHIEVSSTSDDLQKFQEFLKLLRTILSKISGQPVETLFDEISSERCICAYPIIHRTENQMRKLITKFMLTNVGLGWSKDSTPKEVVDSIKNPKPKSTNFLYEVDFIQLSKFLFSTYASLDYKNVIDKIKKAESPDDLDLDELKEFVPQSNWERYFASLVDCTSEFLEVRWKRLYELRNKVAHNRFISEQELEEIKNICSEVNEKLESAINNLDNIHISEEQVNEVAENIAINRDEVHAQFIRAWNALLKLLHACASEVADETESKRIGQGGNWRSMANILRKYGVINKEFKKQLNDVGVFKNTLVRHTDAIFPYETITDKSVLLISLYEQLSALHQSEETEQESTQI
ncbi:HEPN domain-containing protein [Vibrio alginolyticus]|uniref:HEPN domain-containing protein n=1 Tax=Vibrio TaxID=662 RepID=UPI0014827216|nr:HEPN domain-containing protein [Vibrio sp. 2-1(7)]NNN64363.1 hypothetical protein [Vibrio sp. 2-1(7)]